jgi:hypothetical protein
MIELVTVNQRVDSSWLDCTKAPAYLLTPPLYRKEKKIPQTRPQIPDRDITHRQSMKLAVDYHYKFTGFCFQNKKVKRKR